MGKKASSVFIFCFTTISLVYILFNPYLTAYHAQNAIKMCATSLVPTLFVFMVFSRMLSHLCTSDFFGGKAIFSLAKLLNLPVCLIPICISGLFCGAPSGAFAICRLYDEGYCTEDQAQRACILANNCSAAFILGFVSALLGSAIAGIYIFISNIAATVTVYLIFFRNSNNNYVTEAKQQHDRKSISEIITESISSSVTATVTLCGYVIFFYTFTQILCEKTGLLLQNTSLAKEQTGFINAAVCSFFEISSGVLHISELYGTEAVVLCAGATAFTGLSMIFQVAGTLSKSKIPIKKYFLSKCICAFVSPIFTVLLMLLSPASVSVSGSAVGKTHGGVSSADVLSLAFITCVAFCGAYLLSSLDKKHKK